MWEILASVVLKLFDWFFKLADRTVVRIRAKYFKYELTRNDPDNLLMVITPYPSRYHAKLGLSHRGRPTTIKNLTLVIGGRHKLASTSFNPVKLEHGDYREIDSIFPVEESLAVGEGTFEIQALDTFDKVYRCKGRFPIGQ